MTGKLLASRNSEFSGNSKAGSKNWPHHFLMSPEVPPHMEKVYSILRQVYGRSPTEDLNDIDENTVMWRKFMNTTLQASVHLGRDCMENLRFTKNQLLKCAKQLFQVTEKLIKYQTEISCLTTIDSKELTWRSTTPPCDKAIEITNAETETYVFADSVLCLGSISDQPVEAWKIKIIWNLENRYLKDLNRIDGEPMAGFTTLDILKKIQKYMKDLSVNLSSSTTCGRHDAPSC